MLKDHLPWRRQISCSSVGATAPSLPASVRRGLCETWAAFRALPPLRAAIRAGIDFGPDPLGVGERSHVNCESLPLEDTTRLQLVGLGGQEARTFWKCRSPEKGTGPRLHSTPGQTVTPGFARDCAQEAQVSPAEIYLKTEGVGRRARTPSVQTLGQAIGVIFI